MFPDAAGLERRAVESFDKLADRRWFRLMVAAMLACLHLVMFDLAGHKRLGLPFNDSPTEAPYYADPYANVLGGYPREPHHWSRLIASRWDAEIYIGFALRGLSACPTRHSPGSAYMRCGLAWLPAFGMLGGNVSSVVHLPADVTLILISVLAAIFVNFFWTSRVIVDRIGKLEAFATLLAFN